MNATAVRTGGVECGVAGDPGCDGWSRGWAYSLGAWRECPECGEVGEVGACKGGLDGGPTATLSRMAI